MPNIAIYCARCNGSGMVPAGKPGAGQECRLCQEGVIGVLLEANIQAAVQGALTDMGVQQSSGPLRSEPL